MFPYPTQKKMRKATNLAVAIMISLIFLSDLLSDQISYSPMDHEGTSFAFAENKGGLPGGDFEIYAPAITIVKSAPVLNGSDCGSIPFTFLVNNESSAGEAFVNVVVTDVDLGGIIAGPVAGDNNNNNILDAGESWVYSFDYVITQNDLENGQFGEFPANVTADVQGQGISVSDISHPSDSSADGPTIVDLSNCRNASIGLIKEWSYVDLDGGNPPCAENFLYTFTVRNTGNINLHNIVLNDNLLGGVVPGPTPGTDVGDDGILGPGEQWQYQALYSADLNVSGTIVNQASVSAETLQGATISDLSDDDSFFQDEPTPAPYDEVCTGAFARIGLIKTGAPLDLDSDGCSDVIQYTFTVDNVGQADFENIVLTDPLLGGAITGPTQGDANNDGILNVSETWVYEAQYVVTPMDITNGSVNNQALLSGKLVGFDIFAFDYSDDNSFDENEETVISTASFCGPSNIGLIKSTTGTLEDLNSDGCPETIHYFFTVSNTGGRDLEQVVLNDPLLGGQINGPIQGNDLNNDGILSVNETWTYEAQYPITQADINAGQVTNQASVSALELGTNNTVTDLSDNDSFDEDDQTIISVVGACVSQTEIGLIKSGALADLDGDTCPETIRYTFTVSNIGTIDLDQVVLNDPTLGGQINGLLQGSDLNNDGILSINEIWTYEVFYPITQPDLNSGQVINQADVTAMELGTTNQISDLSDDNSLAEDDQTITSVVGACISQGSIGLIKIGSLIDINLDGCFETIRYDFVVTNTGSITLEQVIVNDALLGGEINGPQPNSDDNNDGMLSPFESWSYIAIYPIDQNDLDSGSVSNQADVIAMELGTANIVSDLSDDNSLTENDQTTTSVAGACVSQAGMGLIKSGALVDLDGDACPETIHYTFTVSNTGTIDLDQVVLNDLSLAGQIIGPLQGVDLNNDGILSAGETWTYEAFHSINQTDINIGQVTNQANVTAMELGTTNVVSDLSDDNSLAEDDQTITSVAGACVSQGSIGLIKTTGSTLLDQDGDGCAETIQYAFTMANTGTLDLEQVVLTDALFVNAISGPLPGNDINGDGILSVGETWTYLAQYPITQQDLDSGQVINQAQVTSFEQGTSNIVSDLSDDDSFGEDDPTITSVTGACVATSNIELIKTGALADLDGDECPESIRYTFTVENIGTIGLHQISITDGLLGNTINGPLSGSDLNNDGMLSPNETWIYEALYSILQTDINVGEVINQAQVNALEEISNNPVSDNSGDVITSVANACFNPTNPVDPNFEIFNGITPNGDGINDYFQINGIENYPDNTLRVFNRWGVLIYEAQGYGLGDMLFKGLSEGRATIAKERELPSGTYFYLLTFSGNNPGKESYSGYIYINRD